MPFPVADSPHLSMHLCDGYLYPLKLSGGREGSPLETFRLRRSSRRAQQRQRNEGAEMVQSAQCRGSWELIEGGPVVAKAPLDLISVSGLVLQIERGPRWAWGMAKGRAHPMHRRPHRGIELRPTSSPGMGLLNLNCHRRRERGTATPNMGFCVNQRIFWTAFSLCFHICFFKRKNK